MTWQLVGLQLLLRNHPSQLPHVLAAHCWHCNLPHKLLAGTLPQAALAAAKEVEKQAKDAAAVSDAKLLNPPQIELLLDPAALEKDDEKVLANSMLYRYHDRVPDVERKRRRLSYKNLLQAEEAAAAAAEEDEGSEEEEISEDAEQQQISGSEDEVMEDAAAAVPAADAGPAAAPAAAGNGGEAAAAAAPAAAPAARPAATATHLEPAAELLHCAYGRVAVLYASWTEPSQVNNYIWSIDELQTAEQRAARGEFHNASQNAESCASIRPAQAHAMPGCNACGCACA